MVFPSDPLTVTFELALGADLTADPSTWVWTDISQYCRPEARIRAGRSDWQSSASSAQMTVTVDNQDGRFTRLNPNGAWYGQLVRDTPIRVKVTDGVIPVSTRFVGLIAELPPRWSAGYHDRWVPITANGVLRRLDQIDLTDSALKRFVLGTTKLRAYWPLEDGRAAIFGAPAVSGQNPMKAVTTGSSGVSWGGASDLPGSASVVSLGDGATIGSRVVGSQRGTWMVSYAAKGELKSGAVDGNWTSMRIEPADTDVQWIITGTDTNVAVQMRDINTGVVTTVLNASDNLTLSGLTSGWHSVAFAASGLASGPPVTVSIFVDGELGDTTTVSGRNVGRVDQIFIPDAFDTADIASMGVGHVAVWDGVSLLGGSTDDVWRLVKYHQAATGFDAETAGDRIRRSCTEEGIPSTVSEGVVVGNLPASSRLGPQSQASIASLLREAETADGGLLYETTGAGIGYVARSALYERAVDAAALALNFDAGHVDAATGFEPADDDQQLANEVTVSRSGGSSATVSRVESGELTYPRSVSLSLAADGATAHQAGWRAHLGTTEEYRYPVIGLDLARNTALIDDWIAAGIGSRITAANPPPGHPPDDLDLFLIGYTETLANYTWKVSLNCAPASPYQVGSFPGVLTTVVEDFEDATLNFTVTTGGSAAWFRTEDDAFHGSWSWRSGDITNSQTSDAIVTVPAGCTRVIFRYRTSSESGFDFFRVIVGGNTQLEASGVSGWVQSDYIDVTPGSTVTFRYIKDAGNSQFGDRVYVDDVQFEGGAESDANADRGRLDTSRSELASGVTSTATSFSVATTQGPIWVTDPNGLDLDGVAGDYASTSDAAVLDITGDLDLRADVTPASWNNGSNQDFIAKWDADPAGNASYLLGLSSGRLRLVWTADGTTAFVRTSTVDVGATNGTRLAVRATLDVDDGAGNHVVTFYTAPDIDGTWTILGTAVTTAGATSIFSGIAPAEVGTISEGITARTDALFHAAEIRSGIGGTLAAKPDFRAIAPGATSFTDSTGLVWTLNGNASITGDFPIDLAIGGEVVRATAITGATSPQTFTVIRSINEVVKSHTAGAAISLADPLILALGD